MVVISGEGKIKLKAVSPYDMTLVVRSRTWKGTSSLRVLVGDNLGVLDIIEPEASLLLGINKEASALEVGVTVPPPDDEIERVGELEPKGILDRLLDIMEEGDNLDRDAVVSV